jgi:ParB-like chromosome segregation protein Spo0J
LKIPGGNLASEAAAQVRSQVTERTKIVIENRPAAALFATMGEDEFQALVADIGKNGQREPIVVHEGEVLDGRHRLKA